MIPAMKRIEVELSCSAEPFCGRSIGPFAASRGAAFIASKSQVIPIPESVCPRGRREFA